MTDSRNVGLLHARIASRCKRCRMVCRAGGVAVTRNLYGAVHRRGPRPVFTERMELRLRPDQAEALARIASVLGVTVSDLARWFIDEGTKAIEGVPTWNALKEFMEANR